MNECAENTELCRSASCDGFGLLAKALDHAADGIRVFRRRDDESVEPVYCNRSAAATRAVTERELAEALVDPQGEVLRPGPCSESVHSMRVWPFATSDGEYLISIERDATEHDRLERAYDDAVARRRRRRERTVHHVRNIALVLTSPDEGIASFLDCMLSELGMTTAVLALANTVKTYRWSASDKHEPPNAMPEHIIASALAAENAVHVVRVEGGVHRERSFIYTHAATSSNGTLALCFAAKGANVPLSDDDADFLTLSAQLMAEVVPLAVRAASQRASFAKRGRYRLVTRSP